MYIIAGLGNPGEEYKETRHNAGRIAAEYFAKASELPEFSLNKKYLSLVSSGEIKGKAGKKNVKEKVMVLLPETFMNKSGNAVKGLITSVKKAAQLIVIQDDLDMPIGKIKILFNRGSGGHKGIESIKRAIKTEAFTRVKIGISPETSSGKLRKPNDEDKVIDFIVGSMKKDDLAEIKKVSKRVSEALTMIVLEGRDKAMGEFNCK
jgi:PTH1 family peptidyl-tRNA hydrolase